MAKMNLHKIDAACNYFQLLYNNGNFANFVYYGKTRIKSSVEGNNRV